jgi:hypothetical protein
MIAQMQKKKKKQVFNTLATTAASFSKEMSFKVFFKEGTTFRSCRGQKTNHAKKK